MLDPVGSDFWGNYGLWGDREEQADIWAAHDPVGMARPSEGKPLYVSWQDGQPGPLDPPGTTADSTTSRPGWPRRTRPSWPAWRSWASRSPSSTGQGTHTWPYWQQGLHHALPMLLDALED